MTDDKPDGRDVVSEIMDAGPGGIIAELTGEPPTYTPDEGLRAEVDSRRFWRRRGRGPGVAQDVDDHTSCAMCTETGAGEQLLQVDDKRLVPGGLAEEEWNQASARHREGQWPRPEPQPVDRARLRHS